MTLSTLQDGRVVYDKRSPTERGLHGKNRYSSVLPISKKHQKYLRFQWNQELYEYITFPFGLAEGPRLFTKIMKPVVGLLRRMGVRLIIYLDDILFMAADAERLVMHRNSVLYLLQNLGFIINWKSHI